MKKYFISALCALAILGAIAQVKTQPTTNGKTTTEQVTTQPTQAKKVKHNGTLTTHTYKGYPVYQGSKGGYYVIRTSKKTGNEYTQYIKPEQFDKK